MFLTSIKMLSYHTIQNVYYFIPLHLKIKLHVLDFGFRGKTQWCSRAISFKTQRTICVTKNQTERSSDHRQNKCRFPVDFYIFTHLPYNLDFKRILIFFIWNFPHW